MIVTRLKTIYNTKKDKKSMKKAQKNEQINLFKYPLIHKYIKDAIKVDYIYGAFETHYKKNFYFSGEFHPFWEFVYVISGCVGASGDDRIYYLKEGNVIFHKPMEFHRLWAVDDFSPHLLIVSFQIDGSFVKKFENGVFALNNEQNKKILELLYYLKANTSFSTLRTDVTYFLDNWNEPLVSQTVANKLEGFFLSVLEKEILQIKEDSREEIKAYKKIISVLIENTYRDISLDEIAKQCNMSKSQLKRIFAATSATSIHKYIIKLKIAEAMKLIGEGVPVFEVSERLSFSSSNYFSTVFKRETGMSPTEYKKQM